MSEYQAAFFIVPSRILNLPNITLAYLRIYETIFQFLNHGKPCFLSNEMIKERTGVTSISTLIDSFKYFEAHGELKRITKDGKRYFIQPSRHIEIIKESINEQPVDKGIATAIGGYRQSDRGGIARAIHNTKKLNLKNINKDFGKSKDQTKDQKTNKEQKQLATFWGPGHPDYDRLNI